MANTVYAQARVFYNSQPITKLNSVTYTPNPGIQPVNIMNEGLDGFTIGSGDVQIEVGFTIPSTGTEFDFDGDARGHIDVELQYSRGDKSYAGVGKIIAYNETQSDNEALTGTFTWQGPLDG
jgi:hypothetical protein